MSRPSRGKPSYVPPHIEIMFIWLCIETKGPICDLPPQIVIFELSGIHSAHSRVAYFSRFNQIVQSIHILFDGVKHSRR